jgi:aspartyl-tRNA synthetase
MKELGCGQIRESDTGSQVELSGWVNRRRDHGGLIFLDLRDSSGIVQVVIDPTVNDGAHVMAEQLRSEWVIEVLGTVHLRPIGSENDQLTTGRVEVHSSKINVLNQSKTPPFSINEDSEVDEYLTMKYRPLYLRRPRMMKNLRLRHKVVKFIRDFFDEREFLEIETPILIKATPEGARDYLVPSRVHPGSFYALPQSPQQLKQLLMVAGFEKYFQIARCFRDEDLRADRQPEFTQLDVELSFVDTEDILGLMENLFVELIGYLEPDALPVKPFQRLPYKDAMSMYGTDKPDLRYGMQLRDVTNIVQGTNFQVFNQIIASGGVIKAIVVPGCSGYNRRNIDELNDLVKQHGAGGVVPVGFTEEGPFDEETIEQVRSPVAKHLGIDVINLLKTSLSAGKGDLVLMVAGTLEVVNGALSALRIEFGTRLGMFDDSKLEFAFVTDFPLFQWDTDAARWKSVNHPFTAATEETIHLLDQDPGAVVSKGYDLICNGVEIAGGSIRIHTRDIQEKILLLLGHDMEQAEDQFGHLMGMFEYGAPPHGGFACGIDRLMMILAGEKTIREVIAFPKTQTGADIFFGAPSSVDTKQISDLHITVEASDI